MLFITSPKTHSPCIIGTLNSLIDISSFRPYPQPFDNHHSILCFCQSDYFRFHMWDHSVHLSAGVCLISLSIMSSRFIHVAANGSISFKKMAGTSYVYIIFSLSVCSLVSFSLLPYTGYSEKRVWSLNGPTRRSCSLAGGGWEQCEWQIDLLGSIRCVNDGGTGHLHMFARKALTRASDYRDRRGETATPHSICQAAYPWSRSVQLEEGMPFSLTQTLGAILVRETPRD